MKYNNNNNIGAANFISMAALHHLRFNLFPVSHNNNNSKSQQLLLHSHRQRQRMIHFRQQSPKAVEKRPGVLDPVFLNLFRNKMVQEVGWDSDKEGYDGLIDVANRLMLARTNSQTQQAAVSSHIKILVSPLVVGALQNPHCTYCSRQIGCSHGRVTALSCPWLMGTCTVNSVDLPDGSSLPTGVFVERCKYLEESKCVGICVNTCKLPTQEFFMDHMGVPLLMEPNFNDYSCQFKFGVIPPQEDNTLKEPCLEVCPNATRRRTADDINCPKA